MTDNVQVLPSKSWWTSKTVWSDILTIVMALAPAVDTVCGTHVTSNPFFGQALAILGAMGIHGRLTANTTIGG